VKISKVVKQLEEFKRLEGLIDDIKYYIETIDKAVKKDKSITSIYIDGCIFPQETLSITMSYGVSNLIRSDLKDLFIKHLAELKAEQDKLEV